MRIIGGGPIKAVIDKSPLEGQKNAINLDVRWDDVAEDNETFNIEPGSKAQKIKLLLDLIL